MTAIASIIVVEAAHGVDHGIGDRGTDKDLRNTIAVMVGTGTERHHQTNRNPGSDQPTREGFGNQRTFNAVHDLSLSETRPHHALRGLTEE
jgi:hypothetical protein